MDDLFYSEYAKDEALGADNPYSFVRPHNCTCNDGCVGCPGGWCHDCTPDIEAGHSKSCPVRKGQS